MQREICDCCPEKIQDNRFLEIILDNHFIIITAPDSPEGSPGVGRFDEINKNRYDLNVFMPTEVEGRLYHLVLSVGPEDLFNTQEGAIIIRCPDHAKRINPIVFVTPQLYGMDKYSSKQEKMMDLAEDIMNNWKYSKKHDWKPF